MILGKIIGKVSTTSFEFSVSDKRARKYQFIQVNHPNYNYVLCQIMELERTQEEMIAKCSVIGYKDQDGRIRGIRTPFNLGIEVLEAQDSFIKEVIELDSNGGYIGKLEGKDIPIYLNLQKILTKHLCVLAKSGAGKSYAVGVLLEEIMEKNVPLLIIDPHGEYSSMKRPAIGGDLASWKLQANGYSQIQEYGDMSLKEDVAPLKLDEKMTNFELIKMLPLNLSNTQEAILFSVIKDLEDVTLDNVLLGLEQINSSGKWSIMDTISYLRNLQLFSSAPTMLNDLIAPRKCSIINLKGMDPEVQDIIVYKLLKDLFLARKQGKIPPFFCVIEEAHNFAPEKGFGKAKSLDVIRLISSEGRKFGLGLCVVSQRPALVQKTILAQCSSQLIMKVTNPNDLRAIMGSIEGITADTEQEIQNLPVGTALVCGVVERPLIVTIRPRRSEHGGEAVDVLGSSKGDGEEYKKDIIEETSDFADKGLIAVIKSKITIKDLHLMSQRPIKKITTYLIPAIYFTCEITGSRFHFLIDKIKGNIIIDPETDDTRSLNLLDGSCEFVRKPVYENIEFDTKLEEKIDSVDLRKVMNGKCKVIDFLDCHVVFRKVEYGE